MSKLLTGTIEQSRPDVAFVGNSDQDDRGLDDPSDIVVEISGFKAERLCFERMRKITSESLRPQVSTPPSPLRDR